jgi:hypothetical protein
MPQAVHNQKQGDRRGRPREAESGCGWSGTEEGMTKIAGFGPGLGRRGILAAAAMSDFADRGGVALFGRPPTEMTCAGAPLEYAFLAEDTLRTRGNRGRAELIHNAQDRALFSVPIVSGRVRMLCRERDVKVNCEPVLTGVDLDRRTATFRTPQGSKELDVATFWAVFQEMRGPIDWVVVAGIVAAGAGGTMLGIHALLGVVRRLA